jgi:Major tropism determinant N-terminal domain
MMSGTAGATIRLRRDTAANWAAANPVLALAEPGLEIDTNSIKYGNGVTAWNSLPYASVPLSALSESIIPAQNEAVDLGADEQRFGELYLSGNSIYLGNVVLSASGSTFMVNGEPLPDFSKVMVSRGADANNWNNITVMGTYTVNRTSWSGTTGTPLDSQIFVGVLEVMSAATDTDTAVTQIFYPGITNSNPTVQFTRSNWNGQWTSWYRMLNQEQIVSGGLF